MATRPARCVQRDAQGQPVQDPAHHGLLDLEQLVAGLVVPRRPLPVALLHRHRRLLDTVAELVGRVEQRAYLLDAGERELPVVLPGERAQQRDALETEDVRQGVLKDRRRDRRLFIRTRTHF